MRFRLPLQAAVAVLALVAASGCNDPVSIPRERPVAQAAADIRTLYASNPDPAYDGVCETGAIVRFMATGSYDPAGRQLTYEWRDVVEGELVPDFGPNSNPLVTGEAEFGVNLYTIGVHEITLTVTAPDGRKSSASLRIFVGPCGSCGW